MVTPPLASNKDVRPVELVNEVKIKPVKPVKINFKKKEREIKPVYSRYVFFHLSHYLYPRYEPNLEKELDRYHRKEDRKL